MSISTISRVYIDRMSLPTFKFTKLGEATNNESANSGLSAAYKMSKSGLTSIKEKAQETFREDENARNISRDIRFKYQHPRF